MKICPACQTTYDDAQNFCLKDGTSLIVTDLLPQPVEPLEPLEEKTVVRSAPPPSIPVRQTDYVPTASVPPVSAVPPLAPQPVVVEKKSNTGKVIALTALATLLLATLVGAGVYFWLQNRDRQVAQVNTNANAARPRNANLSNAASSGNVNANAASNTSANVAANVSANTTNVNANVLPSPAPSLSETAARTIRENVSDTVGEWKDSTENGDIESHMSFYAPTVNYYRGGNVSIDRVRSDRQKAFDTYPNMEVDISNVKVTPDPSGEKATAVFDKAWRFENDGTTSEGKVQQQLTLEKRGERWYITGERDLKQYYQSKY